MMITGSTMVQIAWLDGEGNPPPCTWAEFRADNIDGLDNEDFVEIAKKIAAPGGIFQGGGGAEPVWFICRFDPLRAAEPFRPQLPNVSGEGHA